MGVGAIDLHMTFVSSFLDKYIIRCTISRSSVDSGLNGGIGLTLANHSVEGSEGSSLRLVPSVRLGVNLSVGHTIEEDFQIRVSARSQFLSVAGIVRIQAHLSLVGIRQSVAVRIHHLSVVAVALQAGIAGDVNLLVVCCIVALVEGCKLVVPLQGDVVGCVDDAHTSGQRRARRILIARKLRVKGAGGLSQYAGVDLVVAGQRGSGALHDGLEGVVSTLVLQSAPLND